jgi:uncharacterized membrane protein (UPF0127 family)
MRTLLIAVLAALPLLAGGGGTVAFKQHTFMAEVAATDPEKAKGLMYRQSLAKDRCMFFVYSEDGYHAIWMKNCLIALDVAWVDADGRVAEVAEDVPPCSPMRGDDCPTYGGTVPSRYFIEFPVGTFKRLGLRKGDRLGWDLTLDDGTRVKGGAPVPEGRKKRK